MGTIFLSKIIGIYCILIGAAYLINPQSCKKALKEITNSYGLSALSGSFIIVLGLIILIKYNFWSNLLEIVISLIGYLLFISGFIFIFFPKSVYRAGKKIQKHPYWILIKSVAILLIGVFLTYNGFINK